MTSTIVLVAHGSRDPRAAQATRALAAAVRADGRDVEVAYLDFAGDRLGVVLDRVSRAGRTAVVVPLLLTAAYHGRIDVPAELAAARVGLPDLRAELADVLGPVDHLGEDTALELLVGALCRRLAQSRPTQFDGPADAVLVAAAGSRDLGALGGVDTVAVALGRRLGLPVLAGYASGVGRSVTEAVALLRATGARRVAMACHFLAPGRLADRAAVQAAEAGVSWLAEPFADAPEVAELVLSRAAACVVAASH